jgi:hypothetical protein
MIQHEFDGFFVRVSQASMPKVDTDSEFLLGLLLGLRGCHDCVDSLNGLIFCHNTASNQGVYSFVLQ